MTATAARFKVHRHMRRLHPVSPLFWLAKLTYQMLYPMIGAFAWSSYQSQWVLYGLMAAIVVGALWQYVFYHFALEDDQLVVAEGLLFRKNRKVPYARVQNINTSQNPLHRFLGVATVQLESASGGKPEAVLRVVDMGTVEALRQKIQAAHANSQDTATSATGVSAGVSTESATQVADTASPEAPAREAAENLLRMPLADVLRYGLVSQKGLLVFALVSGFFSQNPRWYQNIGARLAQLGWLPEWSRWSQAQVVAVAIALVLVIFLLLQVFTVVWALLRFYDFRLWQKPGRLFAEMGLLSRMTATIPNRRIQLYRVKENPLHQWLGGATVTVETAGGVNTEQQGLVMRWLAPYIPKHRLAGFLERIEPGFAWQQTEWKPIPIRAWRRVFKRQAFFWLLLVIGATVFLWALHALNNFWLLPVPVVVFLLGLLPLAWHAKAWVRRAGYALDESRFSTRSGVFFRHQAHVKLDKVQVINLSQSLFDRRHGMATLRVDTAGGNPLLQAPQVRYLPIAEAQGIRDFILAHLGQQARTGQPVQVGNALQSGA